MSQTIEEFIAQKDYIGALQWLRDGLALKTNNAKSDLQWIGYFAFMLTNWARAIEAYTQLLAQYGESEEVRLNIAICLFGQKKYAEAYAAVENAKSCPARTRLQLYASHRLNDEDKLKKHYTQLSANAEDQLCLASLHYNRRNYQEAIDIYKKFQVENPQNRALEVYLAMCYYRLQNYAVADKLLFLYCQWDRTSSAAMNLKASNQHMLYLGGTRKITLEVTGDFYDHPLSRHNLVVFNDGANSQSVLPQLLDSVPEARLNLAIYYLKHNDAYQAHELLKEAVHFSPEDYILKGVILAILGQANNNKEQLESAKQLLEVVGSSQTEGDTIPGRQCMASVHFLAKNFKDANIYLSSIEPYFLTNDTFNYNYGVSLASTGDYKQALECLLRVKDEEFLGEHQYKCWLSKCYIMNHEPGKAWEVYLKILSAEISRSMPESPSAAANSRTMLESISGLCYQKGFFLVSTKAFVVLYLTEPKSYYIEGARSGVIALFQMTMANQDLAVELGGALYELVRARDKGEKSQQIINVLSKWFARNNIAW